MSDHVAWFRVVPPRDEEAARTITRAGWWIDQRSSEPDDLTELLQAATEADRPTENPHF
ncbi:MULTISPECIES: hypothetical protein [unclassified Streptomyces]|uniref:hypothetical protein n=1 Tax=unclassified Streptomyces TaxID=2593676 RepID=UPI000B2D5DE2|nr:hypothetical protein [Streptomyces sp. TSRI0281]